MLPVPDLADDALDDHLTEQGVNSTNHPTGTCRTGVDDGAVVDPTLAVHGMRGLSVVDASVMPTVVRGDPHASTIMVAERGSTTVDAARS